MDEWMSGEQFDGVSIGRIWWKGAFATMNMFWLKEESPYMQKAYLIVVSVFRLIEYLDEVYLQFSDCV